MLPLWKPSPSGKIALPSAREVEDLAADLKIFAEDSRELAKAHADGTLIAFKDVGYTVKKSLIGKDRVELLSGVTAALYPGEMAALMGPSGSGKTTLLDILAGRKTVGRINGTVRFNGQTPTANFLSHHTGYVEQTDTLIGNMTVREMLQYTAEMKNPRSMSSAEKIAKVDSVLEQLALTGCQHILIGTPLRRGASGGQRKRVNIALALMAEPRLLFLDEPSSGLDSFTANEVMTVVKGLLHQGITICATIHAPSPTTFGLFDRMLMLLSGRLVYFGPSVHPGLVMCQLQPYAKKGPEALQWLLAHGSAPIETDGISAIGAAAVEFFQDTNPGYLRFGSPDAPGNVAEWIVDLVVKADRDLRGPDFAAAYAASPLCAENARRVDEASMPVLHATQEPLHDMSSHRSTTVNMFWGMLSIIRHLESVLARVANSAGAPSVKLDEVSMPVLHATREPLHDLSSQRSTTVTMFWGMLSIIRFRWRRDLLDPAFLFPRLADKMVVGFVIFSLYWHAARNPRPETAANIISMLYTSTLLAGFVAVTFLPGIMLDRALFLRERADGMYHTLTYITAKLLEEALVALVGTFIFTMWIWWALEMHGSWVAFWLSQYAATVTGVVLAYLIAALSPTLEVASCALPTYTLMLAFFTGLPIRPIDQPAYWHWFSYIDYLQFNWSAQMSNQFRGQRVVWVAGKEVLSLFSIHRSKWVYLGYQCIFVAVFFVMAWAALRFVRFSSR